MYILQFSLKSPIIVHHYSVFLQVTVDDSKVTIENRKSNIIISDFLGISQVHRNVCVNVHLAVFCNLDYDCFHNKVAHEVHFHQYHKIDMDIFKADLNNTSFAMAPADDPITLYEQNVQSLLDVMNKHAPVTVKIT